MSASEADLRRMLDGHGVVRAAAARETIKRKLDREWRAVVQEVRDS